MVLAMTKCMHMSGGGAGAGSLTRSSSKESTESKRSEASARSPRSSGSSNSKQPLKVEAQEAQAANGINTSPVCPCDHNDWDNVRVKKGHLTLRCRVCQKQWKTEPEKIRKCLAFFQGTPCPQGAHCPLPHVHRKKQSLAKRIAVHGDVVRQPSANDMDDSDEELPPLIDSC
eukprot:gene14092-21574_t